MPLSDSILFFREFLTTFQTTGAIAPSSRGLARVICQEASRYRHCWPDGNLRLLEVGPGTGVFTQELCRLLKKGDHLDVVELNDRFVTVVREKIQQLRLPPDVSVQVIHADALQHRPNEPYHHVVSGLPLNNFPPELVRRLLEHLLGLLKSDGTLSYFEYIALPRIKRTLTRGPEARRLTRVCALTRKIRRKFAVAQHAVWFNVPPAWVHVLKKEQSCPSAT